MGCGTSLSKCFLIIANSIFLVFGAGLLGAGIYILVDKNQILVLTRSATGSLDTSSVDVPSLLETAAYALIGAGSVIFIIAFLGWCGACMENNKCLIVYAVIVAFIFVVEVVAVILAVVYKDQFETYAKDNLLALEQSRYKGPYDTSDVVSLAFDLVHIVFQCCGVSNATEFASISSWNNTYAYDSGGGSYVTTNATMPLTCCKFGSTSSFPNDMTTFITSMTNNQCPVTQADSNIDTPCYDSIKNYFLGYFNIVIGVGAAIAALEILGVICACCLIKKEKKDGKIGKV